MLHSHKIYFGKEEKDILTIKHEMREAMTSYLKLNAVAGCTLTFAAVLTVFTDVGVSSHAVTDFFCRR